MACVFVCPFLGRRLLSVSPQPGTSWAGKVIGKGSTMPTFKEPQSESGQTTREPHLGSELDLLASGWHQLWSRAPGPAELAACGQGWKGRAPARVRLLASRAEPWST